MLPWHGGPLDEAYSSSMKGRHGDVDMWRGRAGVHGAAVTHPPCILPQAGDPAAGSQYAASVAGMYASYVGFGRRLKDVNPISRLGRQGFDLETLLPIDSVDRRDRRVLDLIRGRGACVFPSLQIHLLDSRGVPNIK